METTDEEGTTAESVGRTGEVESDIKNLETDDLRDATEIELSSDDRSRTFENTTDFISDERQTYRKKTSKKRGKQEKRLY